ncbi:MULTISPECIES: hypothetical protein [unclassified Coleofasciculus]|nr:MULTISPECIES: hypothetical protein [unclassified Coleofasciculus]MBE9126053.1 hypothetical protein [Coleofasciculus sp. LEGE 07081]MBE9148741.1 hypothetical protein [Coleofasciculus sp. LEGE 07092]
MFLSVKAAVSRSSAIAFCLEVRSHLGCGRLYLKGQRLGNCRQLIN